jgi:hypothetical protein
MPDLAPFHAWIVFVHVLGVFLFLLAHGVSAAVLLRLRAERDPAAVRTLVDLSSRTFLVMGIGAAIWFIAGILAGFSGNYWTSGTLWIWASLLVVVIVGGVMTPLGRSYLDRVRSVLGIEPRGRADQPTAGRAGPPTAGEVDPQALEAAIMSGRPLLLAAIGLGGLVILTWLMMFKPF